MNIGVKLTAQEHRESPVVDGYNIRRDRLIGSGLNSESLDARVRSLTTYLMSNGGGEMSPRAAVAEAKRRLGLLD